MTNIDQFESVFKAADKPQFAPERVTIESVSVITDLATAKCDSFEEDVRRFLGDAAAVPLRLISGDQFNSVDQLLREIDKSPADLICTHRNLHIQAPDYPYSLGVYVDVLTQVTAMPVLLLPNPHTEHERDFSTNGRDCVMAITDHLTGDHHLVSYAAKLTATGGELFLTHVEDEATFQRYIETISRIPAIDTDVAREEILEQLLQEPHDFIRSCREVLQGTGQSLTIEEVVTAGHQLNGYKRLVEEHAIDLLVLNTKDEDQLAMHGLAYPLAVELRETPLLLL
jgi:hypothetical protein